jgi:hypothetical protein
MLLLAAEAPCRVRINITDAYGHRVPAERISMTREGFTAELRQDEVFGSNCGQYILNVSAPGFSSARVAVDLDQTEQIVTVAMRVGALEGTSPSCSVMGQVAPSSEVARIRLSQLFGLYSVDVPLSAAHTFHIANFECGAYMLVVMGPGGCLGTKVLRITAATGRVARVDLSGANLSEQSCSSLR